MNLDQAFQNLNKEKWSKTGLMERLHLLEEVRALLKKYSHELAESDAKMKNKLMGEALYSIDTSMMATAVPVANTLTACIQLYETLVHGKMLSPVKIEKVSDDLYDILVYPQSAKDKIMNGTQKAYLRVKGKPQQVNPLEKPTELTAVIGAGNYSSSLEMVKAMFLDNNVVIHKPHHLNDETDKVWEKVFQPLVDYGAISFVESKDGRELVKSKEISKIYFTGGTATAKAISETSEAKLISECGGNNPCLIVPGDRPWTDKEIRHQATQIASISKLNGGAVCGRIQTIVTSKHWPQREQFLTALKKAILEDTPAMGTYYPGSDKVWNSFQENYANAEIFSPEKGKYKNTDFMVITDVGEEEFAVKNEAFCQIISEVPLDVPANAKEYLLRAVDFCNNQLLGTLGSCILIDDDTLKSNEDSLKQAVTDMKYGGISINTMPPFIFLSPYLTWGGNESEENFVSGIGNFGNVLCFENVEKSILYDKFVSPGHMLITNKKTMDRLAYNMTQFAVAPTWMNMTKLIGGALVDSMKGKDF